MAVTRSFNDASVTLTNVPIGRIPKYLGDLLLEVSSDFTLASVVTDTSSAYSARYRIRDTQLYIFVNYDPYGRLYFYLQSLVGTTYTTIITIYVNITSATSQSGDMYIAYATMDDFLAVLTVSSPSSNYHSTLSWGWFVSTYTKDTVYMAYLTQNASGKLSKGALGKDFAPFATVDGLIYTAEYPGSIAGVSGAIAITTASSAYGSSATTPTGSVAIYNPQHYLAYNASTRWFGRILWGGKYILYILCNTTGAHYIVTPGNTYNIDGAVEQTVFSNIIVPIEA